MGETEVYDVKSSAISDEEEYFIDNGVILELKQYCILLLEHIRNPKNDHSFISQYLVLLRRSSRQSLMPFLDYTLFPLLLLFDGAVNCRSSKKIASQNEFSELIPDLKVSDSVSEGVLLCLEEVLRKCSLGSLDQMVIILKKLAYGAMLSPEEASEEFRVGVIKCFRALLLNLCPCSDQFCPCKQISDWPLLAAEELVQYSVDTISKDNVSSTECLLAFLQSEHASPAVGHWLSLLLKAVDIEAARGHRGSSELRVEALVAFRVLIAKVGTADSIAFYLPGVVIQLGKVLHASKTMISGAAGSTDALNQAIRGLSEYLIIVLGDNSSRSISSVPRDNNSRSSLTEKPLISVVEELRRIAINSEVSNSNESISKDVIVPRENASRVDSDSKVLHVNRTSDWLLNTTDRVNKLLSTTFPHLCIHPSAKVRRGLLAAVKALLDTCFYALKQTRLMLVECLFILVCDDFEDVSLDARTFIQRRMLNEKQGLESDIIELFKRLIEKLPQVIMGNDELLALSHAKKLLAVTYFAGAQHVTEYIVHSPAAATRFLDVFTLCLSHNSTFAGSLNKYAARKPSSSGFMDSISEIKAITNISNGESETGFRKTRISRPLSKNITDSNELPRMPPWFVHSGTQKLYNTLAEILRLVSFYIFTDRRRDGSFSVLIEVLIEPLRELINELRTKQYEDQSWQRWYERIGSGKLVRRACTAVCILNEMVFGLSDMSIDSFTRVFFSDSRPEDWTIRKSIKTQAKGLIVDCIGSILHEYQAPEIWLLPLKISSCSELFGDVSIHFFNDNGVLHQFIIEGIGIFNICLGKDFSSCGFLNSSLYLLLENIICSNFQVKKAADLALHIISDAQNCPTVGHLVLANADYVVDSICRQLRNLDLNPHVPNVLASMLSFIGVAYKILPLLDEPMHSVTMELEILGRHRHPNLTLPFLKAVAEISNATKLESDKLPDRAVLFKNDVLLNAESGSDSGKLDVEKKWECIIFEFNDSKRYRRIVGSIAGSCIASVTPLIASVDPAECLTSLDVIEDGIRVLANVEDAYRHESETKEMIGEAVESLRFHNLLDTLRVAEDEASENRLLPAMNRIWPFLISCFRSKNLVAIRKCCHTITVVIGISGGDFFSRRFLTDGFHIWKFLSSSPFHKKPFTKEDRTPLQLPYRKSLTVSEIQPSEISSLKVQIAVLEMIGNLASNSRSSSALVPVLKKISGMVIGIAYSGVKALRDACENALAGLAAIDSDLIWLLLADVYYSRKGVNLPPPPSDELPEISKLLTPGKEFLYVMYGGQSFGFDVDFNAVENVFHRLHARVFNSQVMY